MLPLAVTSRCRGASRGGSSAGRRGTRWCRCNRRGRCHALAETHVDCDLDRRVRRARLVGRQGHREAVGADVIVLRRVLDAGFPTDFLDQNPTVLRLRLDQSELKRLAILVFCPDRAPTVICHADRGRSARTRGRIDRRGSAGLRDPDVQVRSRSRGSRSLWGTARNCQGGCGHCHYTFAQGSTPDDPRARCCHTRASEPRCDAVSTSG